GGEAGSDQRVLMRPARPCVVAEWVVAGLEVAEGADAPARVELLVEQPLGGNGCFAVVEDPRPQEVSDIGRQAVDLALVAVQRKCVAAALGDPEIASKARLQAAGAFLAVVAEDGV